MLSFKQAYNIRTNTPHSLLQQRTDCSRKVPYVLIILYSMVTRKEWADVFRFRAWPSVFRRGPRFFRIASFMFSPRIACGVSMCRCSAQAIELRDGVYYPMGGFARVGEALGKVCRDLGVEFRFNSPVAEVSQQRPRLRPVTLSYDCWPTIGRRLVIS